MSWLEMWSGLSEERTQKATVWGGALGRGRSGLGDGPCLWVGDVDQRALLPLLQRALANKTV